MAPLPTTCTEKKKTKQTEDEGECGMWNVDIKVTNTTVGVKNRFL